MFAHLRHDRAHVNTPRIAETVDQRLSPRFGRLSGALALLLLFVLSLVCFRQAHAQQPQTQTATSSTNAQWANGVAPGYWPTSGTGLTLNVSAGSAICAGGVKQYSGGTLTLAASTTNYVYLGVASSCAPSVSTISFVAGELPIAVVVTSGSAITSITDVRTWFATGINWSEYADLYNTGTWNGSSGTALNGIATYLSTPGVGGIPATQGPSAGTVASLSETYGSSTGFEGTVITITAYSITSNVVTFTNSGGNGLTSGQSLPLYGFPTSTFFNGQTLQNITVNSSTSFSAPFTHSNASATEMGYGGQSRNSYEEAQGYPFPACNLGGVGSSGDGDLCGFTWNPNTALLDTRGGTWMLSMNNPTFRFGGVGQLYPYGTPLGTYTDGGSGVVYIGDYDQDYGGAQQSYVNILQHLFNKEHNTNETSLGGYGKGEGIAQTVKQVKFSSTQSTVQAVNGFCMAMGDCAGIALQLTYAGGLNDNSDEGIIPQGDSSISESADVPRGTITCTPSCSTGSTAIDIAGANTGSLGDQRDLLDITQASAGGASGATLIQTTTGSSPTNTAVGKIGTGILTGNLASSGMTPVQLTGPPGTFSVSTFVGTLVSNITAPFPSGTPLPNSTFSVNTTSGAVGSGWACFTDSYKTEQAYVSDSSGVLTVSLQYPKQAGALITQGGTCGHYLTMNADTQWSQNDVPVWSASNTYVATNVVNYNGFVWLANPGISNSGGMPTFTNTSCSGTTPTSPSCWSWIGKATNLNGSATNESVSETIRRDITLLGSLNSQQSYYSMGGGISGEANSVFSNSAAGYTVVTNYGGYYDNTTVGFNLNPPGSEQLNGMQVTISGATPTGANGTFALTNALGGISGCSTCNYKYTVATSLGTSGPIGGSPVITYGNSTFTMYPGARVESVYNTSTKKVDGNITLEANGTTWVASDEVEEVHGNMPYVNDMQRIYRRYTPGPSSPNGYGRGWYGDLDNDWADLNVTIGVTQSHYQGYGGTMPVPGFARFVSGLVGTGDYYTQAPNGAVLYVANCKGPTQPGGTDNCTRTDATYEVFGGATSLGNNTAFIKVNPNGGALIFAGNNADCELLLGAGASGSSNGLGLIGPSGTCSAYVPGLSLSGGTTMTSETGTGTSVVTNMSPTISGATLNGTTTVNGVVLPYPNRSVATGATPTFSATATVNSIVLAANVTATTWAAGTDGFCSTLQITENGTGGYTFTWPTNVIGNATLVTTANKHNSQEFCYNSTDAKWEANGPGTSY